MLGDEIYQETRFECQYRYYKVERTDKLAGFLRDITDMWYTRFFLFTGIARWTKILIV